MTALDWAAGRSGEPVASSRCPLCGAPSRTLYEGLHDELYGTAGEWRLARCIWRRCRLVFLDPTPTPEEVARAYKRYFTHKQGPEGGPEYGTSAAAVALHRFNSALLRLAGIARARARASESYLGGVAPGRLLDVGCGAGRRLAALRRLGWEVVGQEVDPVAAAQARGTHHVEVLLGPLERLALAPETFDAVVLNHVIEHVARPVQLLGECWRLVKPRGRLVCVTPNVDCVSRRLFGRRWYGLDPPRHLRVFSPGTLAAVGRAAGIAGFRVRTSAAITASFAYESMARPHERSGPTTEPSLSARWAVAVLVQYLALAARAITPSAGDECVLLVVK